MAMMQELSAEEQPLLLQSMRVRMQVEAGSAGGAGGAGVFAVAADGANCEGGHDDEAAAVAVVAQRRWLANARSASESSSESESESESVPELACKEEEWWICSSMWKTLTFYQGNLYIKLTANT
jgi:hypothetical protein